MKLLILGGTRFLGRHLAQLALAHGHEVTLLHRGQSGPALFPQAQHLLADRNGELSVLDQDEWDVAIDTNAYVPRHVLSVAAHLAGRVAQYQLVSSISAYAALDTPGTDEDDALAELADSRVEAVSGETYGGLKALCEAAAREAFGQQCLVSRPGLLVGPFDPTGRFTWWLQRLQRGGEVLAPGHAGAPVQFIDARDAAAWMLRQAETGGDADDRVFNLTGPATALTLGEFLQTAAQRLSPAADPVRLTWADEAFVLRHGVTPWSDLPVWLPQAQQALHQVSISRALRTGLRCRPLADTLADTAQWAAGAAASTTPNTGLPRPPVGLSAEREAALLQAWHARS